MIGQLIARGGYTFSEITAMSKEERMFIHYHQNLSEQNQMRTLLKALGVVWEKSDFLRSSSDSESSESYSSDVYIPLAMTINPNIHKFVSDSAKKSVGSTSRNDGSGQALPSNLGKIRSMAELSKEDFYKLIGQPIPSKLKKESSI